MAKKKIKMNLFSQTSIQDTINHLQNYKNELQAKCDAFVARCASAGEEVALHAINESPIGNSITFKANTTSENMGCKAILFATGEVKKVDGREPFHTVLAVEFGAGIHYNNIPNPKANDFGFGVGTYPGQIHAFEDGWYYLGEDNKWHYTHGVKATMPMYKASAEIIAKYKKIAKEVFG